jgi:hypothetical protein
VDNWLSRGYLAVVAASLGVFLYAEYLAPDPGFAGIWPILATAPFSIVALLTPILDWYSSLDWLTPLIFSAATVLAGLVNASLLGLLARRLRTPARHPAA